MPRCYFDCLTNGALYADAFGVDLPMEDIPDQAHAVLLNIMGEMHNSKESISVSVTVRAERGRPVYVTHGVVNASCVEQHGGARGEPAQSGGLRRGSGGSADGA